MDNIKIDTKKLNNGEVFAYYIERMDFIQYMQVLKILDINIFKPGEILNRFLGDSHNELEIKVEDAATPLRKSVEELEIEAKTKFAKLDRRRRRQLLKVMSEVVSANLKYNQVIERGSTPLRRGRTK